MKHHSADRKHVLDGLNTQLKMAQAGGSVDKRQMLILILRVSY
ncbi:hypothetical protein FOXG_18991 [Fusarium oxysporum f. sp. lycopersici 4287]|uniref:Uncharacterized protein n=2 Tax=Fusarium oxysporum TaxID=5507 RepID=A0A0J9UTD9_FUSO4|nr:hypothetical protein FOXG_18991 [Fusarium oxysporum f. sp. lycopersici 4287]EXK39118.1 hypothetical protein FOMG_06548 [Fusarium oxysporum f. sp. melonis 26406]KNB02183.1 hypothetical protein FOXG_18991 [Fusarium oxysporum f. sp. lycopersici 4287]